MDGRDMGPGRGSRRAGVAGGGGGRRAGLRYNGTSKRTQLVVPRS